MHANCLTASNHVIDDGKYLKSANQKRHNIDNCIRIVNIKESKQIFTDRKNGHNAIILENWHNVIILENWHNVIILENWHNIIILENWHHIIILENWQWNYFGKFTQ